MLEDDARSFKCWDFWGNCIIKLVDLNFFLSSKQAFCGFNDAKISSLVCSVGESSKLCWWVGWVFFFLSYCLCSCVSKSGHLFLFWRSERFVNAVRALNRQPSYCTDHHWLCVEMLRAEAKLLGCSESSGVFASWVSALAFRCHAYLSDRPLNSTSTISAIWNVFSVAVSASKNPAPGC